MEYYPIYYAYAVKNCRLPNVWFKEPARGHATLVTRDKEFPPHKPCRPIGMLMHDQNETAVGKEEIRDMVTRRTERGHASRREVKELKWTVAAERERCHIFRRFLICWTLFPHSLMSVRRGMFVFRIMPENVPVLQVALRDFPFGHVYRRQHRALRVRSGVYGGISHCVHFQSP